MTDNQQTPVTFKEVTEERYDEMLNVLPPAVWEISKGFLVGEPHDHDDEGRARFAAFFRKNGAYFEATRPMSVREFKAIQAHDVKL